MSLPTINGIGYLLSDGVDLRFGTSGNAWAPLPLAFKERKADGNGGWVDGKTIKIEGMVFGALAEYLSQEISGRQDITVTGNIYTEEYQAKDGSTKTAIRMNVHSAAPYGKPRERVGSSAPAQDTSIPF